MIFNGALFYQNLGTSNAAIVPIVAKSWPLYVFRKKKLATMGTTAVHKEKKENSFKERFLPVLGVEKVLFSLCGQKF